ncbi:sodium calcium exchanger protein (macronuclear) [Tetrahymena thermophila SB210]|uniref:Sodium calcium exchanger protein n=1 Tax=Tetrahymena thermophila (strain SB210) TaxID=312017 RepID=I7MFM5_TETTS|nr:sodium calcium exchanger protein [Tetrahymena thermophila SB210]EAS00353.2 sodium calcium exchanger protein [Tetrahymena thermophila SB210]|eukprot:XP_001020598.2 sodium calcium exchanger protein [Tetrahymena thermophila SB210]
MSDGENNACTVSAIHKLQSGVCEYVDQNCTAESLVRFSYFYFCQVSENIIVLDLLTVLVPLMAFHMLSSTAESYLSPALAKCSKILRLSESVAGVTLLALGNGAPDVITAIIAGGDDNGGISIAIGSIFGAGLFVTTATLSAVIFHGKNIKIDKKTFMRDMVFYLLGCLVILVYAIIGKVNIIMSSIFMSIYLIFLVIVILQDRQQRKELEKLGIDESVIQQELENNLHTKKSRTASIAKDLGVILFQKDYSSDINKIHFENEQEQGQEQEQQQEQACNISCFSEDDQKKQIQNSLTSSQMVKVATTSIKMRYKFRSLKHVMKQKYYSFKDELHEMSIIQKIIYFYEIPVNFIRDLTIPPGDDDQWNKWRAFICCYTTPITFLFITGNIKMLVGGIEGFYLAYLLLGIGFIFSLIVWKYSHENKAPAFMFFFSLLAFVISVAYISTIAQILIDFIQFFQILSGINQTFLGLTLLAYGNSSGDFFTNTQLSKMGYGVMAMTGCFAGQGFNLYIGFGFALVMQTRSSDYDFSLFTASTVNEWLNNGIAIAVLLAAIIATIFSIIVSIKLGFSYEKGRYSSSLIIIYSISILICFGFCVGDQIIS